MENIKNHPTEDPDRIDDLFRKTLEGQRVEPGKNLWRGINRKLLFREMIRLNVTNFPGTFWIAGVAGIVIIPLLLYLLLSPGGKDLSQPGREQLAVQTVPQQGNAVNKTASPIASNELMSAPKPGSDQKKGKSQGEYISAAAAKLQNEKNVQEGKQEKQFTQRTGGKSLITPGSRQKSGNGSDIASNTYVNRSTGSKVSSDKMIQKTGNEIRTGSASRQRDQGTGMESDQGEDIAAVAGINPLIPLYLLSVPEMDTIHYRAPNMINLGIFPTARAEHPVIPQYFSAGLKFMPELSFYRKPSSYTKMNYWFGADLAYHLGRFYIRPVINIGYVNDKGNYQVNYKRNDSVGFYYEVVSYSVDPHTGEILYKTIYHPVYDSLLHAGTDATRTRYQYIQVPLMLGFDLFAIRNVTISVQAGPAISFFMAEQETPTQNADLTGARLLSRTKITPPGRNPNWQLWAGIHVGYRISNNFDVYLEPTYKYYFSPLMTNDLVSVKAPWTIGLGMGFVYNFGFNSPRP